MNVLSVLKTTAGVTKHWAVKHAPELLLGAGVLSGAAAIVSAVKAGEKNNSILTVHKMDLEDVKSSEECNKSDVVKVYARTGLELGKTYAPVAGFAALSTTCFLAAYGIMKKRYVTLATAYTALQNSFRLYRERVIEDGGKEKDLYYLTGEKPKTVTVTDELGNKEKVKVYPTLPDGSIASPYAFKFGKYKEDGGRNQQWQNDRHIGMNYILGQQDYLNDALYCRCTFDDEHRVLKRGSVMLNEIRDLLGEDPTTAGSVVGNRFSNGEPGCDGFINFNVIESTEIDPDTGKEIFCAWIDPNVDGIIYDKLDEWEKEPFIPSIFEEVENRKP